MTPEEKKLLELLEFSVNEKAKEATKMMNQQNPESNKAHFWHGNYMAFNEVYSMIQNIKRTL